MGKTKRKGEKDLKPTSKDFALPTFDEDALSALTARIDRGLQSKDAAATKANPKKQRSYEATGKRDNAHSTKYPDSKKRKRDVAEKTRDEPKTTSKKSKSSDLNDATEEKLTDREVLLREILALGGTEEDLDLVDGAESGEDEAQDYSSSTADHSLKKELASFVAGLGLDAKSTAHDAEDAEYITENDDQDEDEDNGRENDWEDASDAGHEESGAASPAKAAAAPAATVVKPSGLMFEARPDWHAASLPALPEPESRKPGQHQDVVAELKKYALSLLEEDSNTYSSKHLSSTSSQRFLSTIMTSGTLSDKISALTLVVQESPVHTRKSFENLLGLAKKRSRDQAITALGAIKDLLSSGVVLPADRRLFTFATQPGLLGVLQSTKTKTWKTGSVLPGKITKAHLISWAYEDWLKEQYFETLQVLESWLTDAVDFARSRCVTFVYELLKDKPEQESNLLRLLVNKLGDPDKKIASRSSYLILQLQTTHPLMKPIIIKFIHNELLLRPGQSLHAKYYAIITLNQTVLMRSEEGVARNLMDLYFETFVSLLRQPNSTKDGPELNRKGQVQGGGGKRGKKALQKAKQEEKSKQTDDDSKQKIISAVLTGVNRAFPFLISEDTMLDTHMDTLFKITHSSNFNTSIQALILIQQLVSLKPGFLDRYYRTLYESLLDPRLVMSSKHALYLNLLYKSLRSDLNVKRVKAFLKRMLQVLTLHQPPFICGCLYMLRELEAVFPSLRSLIAEPEEHPDMDEEVFRDVPDDGEEVEAVPSSSSANVSDNTFYDGRKRDPNHSNADKTCLWELLPFNVHFHPSVSLFATRLLAGAEMPPKPDLTSHSLIQFLDRFVYRNAKASAATTRGSSIMQPLAGGETADHLLSNRSTYKTDAPVNSEGFWNKKAEDIAVDEVFFHKYFSGLGKGKASKQQKKAAKAQEGEEDEDEIWDALVESRPDIEGDEDESDLDMADFDEDEDDLQSLGGSDGSVDLDFDLDDAEDGDGAYESEEDDEDEVDPLATELEVPAAGKEDAPKQRRRKLKDLPVFASADDYAEMLAQEAD